ncbi:hypothetical protein V9T40_014311 [Parthenolecanium corni]|uniref:Uncharacterized protein n=1 Tax=Parthenolecanium corni TaxID=536013 RepID=A0AAN9T320_9HEMI
MNKFAYANAIFEDDVDNRSHKPLEALKSVLDLSSLVWAIYSRNNGVRRNQGESADNGEAPCCWLIIYVNGLRWWQEESLIVFSRVEVNDGSVRWHMERKKKSQQGGIRCIFRLVSRVNDFCFV